MLDQVIAGLIGAVAGGVVGGVTSYLQVRRSYRVEIDKELREERLTAYKQVWSALKSLSMHRAQPPSP